VIRRLVERLADLRLAGFHTQEVRERGQRVGFETIGLSGLRAVLAHVRSHSQHRFGRYGVNPNQLQPQVQQELDAASNVDVFLIDEVGKMELLCPAFVETVPRLLEGLVPVVMTVTEKGQGLIAQVKARADVGLVVVHDENGADFPRNWNAGCGKGSEADEELARPKPAEEFPEKIGADW
jgi:nucleoside-triphosphatase